MNYVYTCPHCRMQWTGTRTCARCLRLFVWGR